MTKKKVTKKKATRKASVRTGLRKAKLKPHERVDIKRRLISHFGKSKIGTALESCEKKPDIDRVLLLWKKKLEEEIEAEERSVSEYYAQIDKEYVSIGRPKSVLNWREFEYLCSIGCTLEEIAGFFQIAKSALQVRVQQEFGETFTERYEKLSQGMKVALRRKQLSVAMEGDTSMLKFLGKNALGQKDKLDFDGEVKVNSWVDLVNNLEPAKDKENESSK